MNFDPTILHKKQAAEIQPKYRYTGDSPFPWYQEKCRDRLSARLGMDTFRRCDPVFKITEDKRENGRRHIHFTLQTEEGYFTHCDILLPEKQTGPLPLCVCRAIPPARTSRSASRNIRAMRRPSAGETVILPCVR